MYIVGFKHNGNGIDWLREAIEINNFSEIKQYEISEGPQVDAVYRRPGILKHISGKAPFYHKKEIRIRFIKKV